MNEYRTPSSPCPCCGKTLDMTMTVGSGRGPQPGDFSMCTYCGAMGVFNEIMRRRLPTDEELADVAGHVDLNDAQRVRVALLKQLKAK